MWARSASAGLLQELGCSSASMYRYFKNLDELLFYAQLDALNGYILELSNRRSVGRGSGTLFRFGAYATGVRRSRRRLSASFYRNLNQDLGEALKEYYEMFPEAIVRVSPLIKEMLEIPGYYDRDYFICKRLVAEGELTEENAKKLNHVPLYAVPGIF